jgi:hypothetical protein
LNAKSYSVALCAFVRRNPVVVVEEDEQRICGGFTCQKKRDLRLIGCFIFRTNAGQRASKPMNRLAAHVSPAQESRKEAAAAREAALRERMRREIGVTWLHQKPGK